MKKIVVFIAILMVFTLILHYPVGKAAEKFSIRNGIQQGDTKDTVIKRIESEPNSSNYIFNDITSVIIQTVPKAAGTDELWSYQIENIDLGATGTESVRLVCNGTKTHGLFLMDYYIITNNTDNTYTRTQELQQELEKKTENLKRKQINGKTEKVLKPVTISTSLIKD